MNSDSNSSTHVFQAPYEGVTGIGTPNPNEASELAKRLSDWAESTDIDLCWTDREDLRQAAALLDRQATKGCESASSTATDEACGFCGGSGERMLLMGGGPEAESELGICPNCNGTGQPRSAAPDGDSLMCSHCGADRLKTGCALRNLSDCKFIGQPQSTPTPRDASSEPSVNAARKGKIK